MNQMSVKVSVEITDQNGHVRGATEMIRHGPYTREMEVQAAQAIGSALPRIMTREQLTRVLLCAAAEEGVFDRDDLTTLWSELETWHESSVVAPVYAGDRLTGRGTE
jgi:hypothetical protein